MRINVGERLKAEREARNFSKQKSNDDAAYLAAGNL
jgi:hypothetical protein